MTIKTGFDDIFGQDVEKIVDIFQRLNKELPATKKHFKDILTVTSSGVIDNFGETAAKARQVTAAYDESTAAAKGLAEVNLLIAKTEQEQTKTKILLRKETERQTREMQKQQGAYSQMSKQLTDLRNQYKNLAAAGEANTKAGKEMLKSVTALDKKLKEIDATVGQHQRNVGNYTSALEGLPGPIGRVAAGASQLQKVFMALVMNPIGLVLAAVAAAAALLYKAFISTDEGGTLLEARMEQLNAIMNVANQRFSDTGLMVKTFGKALGQLAIGNYTGAVKEFTTALNGTTGQLEEATEAARNYVYELDRIEDAEAHYISQADINKKRIADLEFFAADQTMPLETRKRFLKEAIELRKEESIQNVQFLIKRYLNEVEYAAKTYGVKKATLRAFIEADRATADQMLKDDAQLASARNAMNNDGQVNLEKSYAKVVDAGAEFSETARRSESKYTGMLKDEADKREATRKKAEADLKASNKRIAEESDRFMKEMMKQMELDQDNQLSKEDFDKKEREKKWNAKQQAKFDEAQEMRRLEELVGADDASIKKKKDEDQIQAAKDLSQALNDIAEEADKIADRRSERRLAAIDKEVAASKKREDDLRALALTGQKDAQASIAAEEKRRAELELKREKELQRAKKRELVLSAINTYNSKVQSGDKNALVNTIKDLTLLGAALATIPGFFVGTEDTGEGGNVDDKKGFLSILHPHEKVFNRKHAEKIGLQTPNDLVADTMQKFNNGLLVDATKMPVFGAGNASMTIRGMQEMTEKLGNIEKHVSRVQSMEGTVDALRQYLDITVKEQGKEIRKHIKIKTNGAF